MENTIDRAVPFSVSASRWPRQAATWIGVLLLLATLWSVSENPRRTWDEGYHYAVHSRLMYYGYTADFLRHMGVATGPLFAVICNAVHQFSPLTAYHMRLINVAFLFVLMAALINSLRFWPTENTRQTLQSTPWAVLQLMGIPLVPLMTGMGMTDMVALALFHGHLFFLIRALQRLDTDPKVWQDGIAAGALLSLCLLTRQLFLISMGAGLFFLGKRYSGRFIASFLITALPLPLLLFAVWGGMVAPSENYNKLPFSLLCVSVGLSHAALLFAIFDPRFLTGQKKLALGCLIAGVILSPLLAKWNIVDLGNTVPFWGRAKYRLPAWGFDLYRYGFSGLTLGLSFPFIFYLVKQYRKQKELWARYLFALTGLLLISPGFITHNYSSRYVLTAMPSLLLLNLCFFPNHSKWRSLRLLLGGAFGILILKQYSGELPFELARDWLLQWL